MKSLYSIRFQIRAGPNALAAGSLSNCAEISTELCLQLINAQNMTMHQMQPTEWSADSHGAFASSQKILGRVSFQNGIIFYNLHANICQQKEAQSA